MIKKNRQGRVVVFEDESIFPSRQERKNAASPGMTSESQVVERSCASEDEVEAWHEAAVLKASEDSKTSGKVEMARLAAQVAQCRLQAMKAREVAKQKLKSAKHEAEQACRMAVELAMAEYEDVLDCIRVDFHAAVGPINAEASELLARQKASLEETLSSLDKIRGEKLAALAESKRAPEKTAAEEPASIPEKAAEQAANNQGGTAT